MGGAWAINAARWTISLPRYPVGWAVLKSENAVVHAYYNTDEGAKSFPFCKWKHGAVAPFKGEPFLCGELEQAYSYSSKFCSACRNWLTASTLSAVERVFGD